MEHPSPQPSPDGRGNTQRSQHHPRSRQEKDRAAGVVHIVGAGLAGLSAAVRLTASGHRVAVYEAAGQAGGRCRSYYDPSFGAVIDNGNHLLLSGNESAIRYLNLVGGADKLQGPAKAEFAFADLATGKQWTLSMNDGRWPGWLFDPTRRVPDTKPSDYLRAMALLWADRRKTVTDVIAGSGHLYNRLWQPLFLAALNTDPSEGSARLAGAIMRNTLAKGGAACRPLIAEGLSAAFVEPALALLEKRNSSVFFGRRLRTMEFEASQVTSLNFGEDRVSLGENDRVILAVPPWVAVTLVPGLDAPSDFRAILNAHYRVEVPPHIPQILGLINGTVEWIFAFPARLSITISGADRLIDQPREELAGSLWQEVASVTGLSTDLPPWQIVKEKRATFTASPDQDAKRPGARSNWRNLFLAGDWTQTGLPATIEGAIRSGERAATLAMRGS
jgi:hydroxysqualene dehydroxylase